MRPRHLELTAFGPYPGTVRIDFDELARDGLFLVHGPTGAGKTSLLDGMTYALYGGVAGTRRNDRLRSDHADPRVQTAVAFEFSLRGTDYRVTRVPPHERAKRTGSGTTRQKPKATLAIRAGDGWEPVAEGVEDVGQHIVDLVGLNREQFHQVVVLPQGDFARALHADANERRRLLSSLFRTERFEDYTQRLVARAKDAEAAAAAAGAGVDRIVEQAAGRWSCILTTVEVVPDTVDEMALHASVAADAARAETAAAAEAEQVATAALEEGRVAADAHQRVERARAVLADLEAAHDEVEQVRAQFEAGLRAQPLADYLDVEQEAATAAAAAASRADAARDHVLALAASAPRAVAALAETIAGARTTDALLPLRDGLHEAIADLEAAAQAHREAQDLLDQAAQHEAAGARAATVRAEAVTTIGTLETEQATAQGAREEACRAAERAAALAVEHERLVAQQRARTQLQRLQPDAEAAAAATLAAKAALNAALDAHRRLLEQRIEGMASELAAALVDGDPCAVCGATEHPAPAVPSGDGVGAGQLQTAADEVEGARAALVAAEATEAALREELAAAAAGAGESDDLTAALEDVAQRLAEATATAERLPELDATLAQIATALETGNAAVEAAGVEASAAETARAHCLDRHAQLRATAIADDDPVAALAHAHGLRAATTDLVAAVEDLQRADHDQAAAARRLADVLARHGFDTAEEARGALLDETILQQYRETFAEIDRRRTAAEAVLADHTEAAASDLPDLGQLRADKAAADEALHAAQVRLGVVSQAAEDLADLATRWRTAAHDATRAGQAAANLRRLADICSGAGNAQRMSLERYVLAAYFEEIAEAASQRLQAMTDGRYTLRHSDERARGGAASGLSIVVHDAYTGTEREAGSLSGGETFQASLCLALGVADVVQRHAGGIHLDMLFIDEGFGALDAEALEQAMAELDALREGGRLVGVISHVPALQERIAGGIHVTKTTTGSDARVVVAVDA